MGKIRPGGEAWLLIIIAIATASTSYSTLKIKGSLPAISEKFAQVHQQVVNEKPRKWMAQFGLITAWEKNLLCEASPL